MQASTSQSAQPDSRKRAFGWMRFRHASRLNGRAGFPARPLKVISVREFLASRQRSRFAAARESSYVSDPPPSRGSADHRG